MVLARVSATLSKSLARGGARAVGARMTAPITRRTLSWRAPEASGGVGDRSWSLNTLGGTNSSGQVEWMDELPRDERPPKPDATEVAAKYRAQAAKLNSTSPAPVTWEDEVAMDGGVKRALDNLLETVSAGDWAKYDMHACMHACMSVCVCVCVCVCHANVSES